MHVEALSHSSNANIDQEGLSNEEIECLRRLLRKVEKQRSIYDTTRLFTPQTAHRNSGSTATSSQETVSKLSPDRFSFLVFSSAPQSHVLAVAVFLLQVLIFVCILLDSLFFDFTSRDSTIREDEPARCVSPVVRVIQLVTMWIALLNQEDLRVSFCMWHDGFQHPSTMRCTFVGAFRGRWHWSVLCRTLIGFLALGASTVLIFYSHTVLDVILNFLAVEAVSYVDIVTFEWHC